MNTERIELDDLEIRKAGVNDAETVLFFIKQLADYEKLSHKVTATAEILKQNLFSNDSNAYAVKVNLLGLHFIFIISLHSSAKRVSIWKTFLYCRICAEKDSAKKYFYI